MTKWNAVLKKDHEILSWALHWKCLLQINHKVVNLHLTKTACLLTTLESSNKHEYIRKTPGLLRGGHNSEEFCSSQTLPLAARGKCGLYSNQTMEKAMRAALNMLRIMSVVWFSASVQSGISKQITGWVTIICCLDVHGIQKTDTTDAADVPPFSPTNHRFPENYF